nr:hypothetical protein [Tanacetum cinerariifolium]
MITTEDAMPWVGLYVAGASLACTLAMAADAFQGFRQWKLHRVLVGNYYLPLISIKGGATGYRQVKVLEFFDCPGPRQGVEDLRELLHKGAQGDREAEVFQVSNDDTVVAQRRLKDKQPEKKTNTDSLVKEQEKEYQTGWKIKTGNVLDSLIRSLYNNSGLSKVFWVEDTTKSTYLVNRSPSSAIGLKMPVDMNIGFNESGEYKKTFIGFGVGTGSMQVLQGVEFEVEPQEDHTFEVEPHGNVDHIDGSQERDSNEAAFVVAVVEKIYAHESLTFNNTVSCEVISKWKAGLKDDMDARSDVYVLSNGYRKCSNDSDGYYWDINQTLLEGHSILLLEGSLSGDCDVEKNGKWSCIYAVRSHEYQMVCTRLDIASADVGMCCKLEGNATTRGGSFNYKGGVYGPYGGCEGSYLALLIESRYELRCVYLIMHYSLVVISKFITRHPRKRISFTVPASRRILEHRYKELHGLASCPQEIKFSYEELEQSVKKYWMMAETDDAKLSEKISRNALKSINQLLLKSEKNEPEENKNSWSLVVVTLTVIVVALPNKADDHVDRLTASMREGLQIVRNIEECLNADSDLIDLQKKARDGKTSKEILEWLRDEAVKIVVHETILIHCSELEDWPIDGQLLEWISNMIADILCACFTKLPCVIKKMCHHDAIEKREDSVRSAAQLLGRSSKSLIHANFQT